MSIVERVKALDLPVGDYVVFGSGPLEAFGIRKSGNINLYITTTLYERMKQDGWYEKPWDTGGYYLTRDECKADDSWDYGVYNPSYEEIRQKAVMIDGVPFAPLEEVLKWKRAFGRTKDFADIKLIEQYLRKIA